MPVQWIGWLTASVTKLWRVNVKLTPEELAWLNRHHSRKPFSEEAWIADLRHDVLLRKRLEAARKSGEIARWVKGAD